MWYFRAKAFTIDSLTHIVAGACIGELVAGKKLGKQAMLFGALANVFPDVDIATALWTDAAKELWVHRGFTHSIVFAFAATLLLAYCCKHFIGKMNYVQWCWLFGLNLFFHILIDSCNAYGTALFLPFTQERISFHLLFVADPFFSVAPFIAFVFLWVKKKNYTLRKKIAAAGMAVAGLYLGFAIINRSIAVAGLHESLQKNDIKYDDYIITPTPFNTLLWYAVVKENDGFHIGYRSVFDSKVSTFTFFPQNDFLVAGNNTREMKYLQKFADDFYSIEIQNDSLLFNVLRFGQIVGWHDPQEKFMLHYYLNSPGANTDVVQRGRFTRWNRQTISSFLERIAGN